MLSAHLARAATGRTGARPLRSASRAGTVAGFADRQALELDDLLSASRRFFEFDFEVVAQILAAPVARARPAASGAEEVAENIGENLLEALAEIESAEASPALRTLKGGMAETIVFGAFLGIGSQTAT